jgi:glycosyltransferase involved in cell wall biosynthesis
MYEGFGIPVMEAMCCSGIVTAARVSSLPEVLGDDGLMFDPYRTEDIASTLLQALALSAREADIYRRRCRRRAEAHLARLSSEVLLRTPSGEPVAAST